MHRRRSLTLHLGPINLVDTMKALQVVGDLLYDSHSKRKRGRRETREKKKEAISTTVVFFLPFPIFLLSQLINLL